MSLTATLQAVEVNKVATMAFSAQSPRVVKITVPEDTAELILVMKNRQGSSEFKYIPPKQRDTFWNNWTGDGKIFRPAQGIWTFYVRGSTKSSKGTLNFYTVPYKNLIKPQTIEVKPHKLCEKEYVKVSFQPDTVTSKYLSGSYGFEITTEFDVMRPGEIVIHKSPADLGRGDIREGKFMMINFENNAFQKTENYYLEIKKLNRNARPKVRFNWFNARIEAVGGDISPGRELWMVTHGRDDNPDKGDSHVSFRTLAGTLSAVRIVDGIPASGMVLNWSEGAADNSSDIGLEGSRFIDGVARTARRLLDKRGVTGGSLNLVGHSWGSLVSNALGWHYPHREVARIVALDPPESGTVMGLKLGRIILGDQSNEPDFIRNANGSLAIVTGHGLYGSERRAQTAHVAIRLDIPTAEARAVDNDKRHALPVDTFYRSILERGTNSIASTIWSLALNTGSHIISKNTPRNATVTLPAFLLWPDVSSPEKYFDLTRLNSDQFNFDNHDGVVGIHVNQAGKFSNSLWMGIGLRPHVFTIHAPMVQWWDAATSSWRTHSTD